MSNHLKWSAPLSASPLPAAPSDPPNTDQYMVNSTAVSDDGHRVLAGTYYDNYPGTKRLRVNGTFGVYCYKSDGTRLWMDEFEGDRGVFEVALSSDAKVAAAGGMLTGGQHSSRPRKGFLRAYESDSGHQLLNYTDDTFTDRVNSVALSADGSVLIAGTSQALYFFHRNEAGLFNPTPATPFGEIKGVDWCDISPDGTFAAACGEDGNAYTATLRNGLVQSHAMWTEPAHPHFLSIAVAKAANLFVVGGDSVVLLFDSLHADAGPVASCDVPQGASKSVRSVAIANDGSLVTFVMNHSEGGKLYGLKRDGSGFSIVFEHPTLYNPNAVVMDSKAKVFGVAQGYPDDKPGRFSLYSAKAGERWGVKTDKMSWGMAIDADGKAIAAGSDDNTLYFFVP